MPAVTIEVAEIELKPLIGEARPISQWVFNFPLLVAALDPYTEESAIALKATKRMLDHYEQASIRAGWVLTCDEAGARQFLGPLADEVLTFIDPDRSFVKAVGIERLPALVHIDAAANVRRVANDWNPPVWKALGDELSRLQAWSPAPILRDPEPFMGTPVDG